MITYTTYCFRYKSKKLGKYSIFARSKKIADKIVADTNALLSKTDRLKRRLLLKHKVETIIPPYELEEEQRLKLMEDAK